MWQFSEEYKLYTQIEIYKEMYRNCTPNQHKKKQELISLIKLYRKVLFNLNPKSIHDDYRPARFHVSNTEGQ